MPILAPSNFSVTALLSPGGTIRLEWENPNAVATPIELAQFKIERSLNQLGPFSDLAILPAPGFYSNALNFTYDDLVGANKTYWYRVKAIGPAPQNEESTYTTPIQATSGSDLTYPTIVSGQIFIVQCRGVLTLLEQTGRKPTQPNGYEAAADLSNYSARISWYNIAGTEIAFLKTIPLEEPGILREFLLSDFSAIPEEGPYKIVYQVQNENFEVVGSIEGYYLHAHNIECKLFERAKKIDYQCRKDNSQEFRQVATCYYNVIPQLLKEENLAGAQDLFTDIQRVVECWY